jgi:phosphoribosylanthranilate isomerase
VADGIRVKICGLVRREDALDADAAGADYLGVVVSPGFRRSVDASAVRGILEGVRAKRVAVMVDPDARTASEAVRSLGADVVQLHGEEPPDLLRSLRGEGTAALWKAVRARSLSDVEAAVARYADVADGFLVEGWMDGVFGGGGARLALDPGRVRALIPPGLEFILAGGLDADSVGAAVSSFRPDIVDVSSGVERTVGVKDHGLVSAFIQEARAAGRRGASPTAPVPDAGPGASDMGRSAR